MSVSRPECGAATVCPGANLTHNTMSIAHNPPAFPTPPVVSPDGTTHDNGQEGMTIRKKILDDHAEWLLDNQKGCRANLFGADLSGANLFGVNLSGANLFGVNLFGAKNIYTFGPMPTSKRICHAVWHGEEKGWLVQAGCFWGSLDELEKAVMEKHSCPVYLANIAILRAYKPN